MVGGFSPIDANYNRGRTLLAVGFELASMLSSMLEKGDQRFTPEFWWPEDRAWLVWTDWDLMGTKVFGNHEMVGTLRDHSDIETLDWREARPA